MMVVASCISKDFSQQFYPAFYKGAFKDQYFGILVYVAKAENMGGWLRSSFLQYMDKIWAENMISPPIFHLCQQVPYSTLSEWPDFSRKKLR